MGHVKDFECHSHPHLALNGILVLTGLVSLVARFLCLLSGDWHFILRLGLWVPRRSESKDHAQGHSYIEFQQGRRLPFAVFIRGRWKAVERRVLPSREAALRPKTQKLSEATSPRHMLRLQFL
jgi:hypothetical protein